MVRWRCERCGYIHIEDRDYVSLPRRCPICRSSRIRLFSSKDIIEKADKLEPSTLESIYRWLKLLPKLSIDEQKRARRRLKDLGVHILSLDEDAGSLDKILSREEAEAYKSLIERTGFGLAVIEGVTVAVSPDSALRLHVGVSERKLKEIERALSR